jgi:anti-sigma regulatory factor (Ser/Thr protein kinase)
MAGKLNVAASSLAEVRVCIKEVFNNINDHSSEETGFVHVQLFPGLHKFCLTIADFGVGIPSTMARRHKFKNDGQAIEMATYEGVTSKDPGKVAGAGLAYLARYVALANRGKVTIYSGNGSLRLSRDSDRLFRSPKVEAAFFPGTLLNLDFRTDTIAMDDDGYGELEW